MYRYIEIYLIYDYGIIFRNAMTRLKMEEIESMLRQVMSQHNESGCHTNHKASEKIESIFTSGIG